MRIATATRPRPGYVYAMETPALPGLVKVGHTHRPPHRRAAELSRTAVPLPFEVSHARFFWNAPGVEAALHRYFAAHRRNRRREFFEVPVATIAGVMDSLKHDLGLATGTLDEHDPDAPFAWRVADPDWAISREGLEEQWGWAVDDLASRDPAVVRLGWSRMEAMSAAGWDEGTWRLADTMMRRTPNDETARRAAWVLDAAACQGHPSAAVRASWLRSFLGPEGVDDWRQCVSKLEIQLADRDVLSWPEGIRETLEAELRLPQSRVASTLFSQLLDSNRGFTPPRPR